ncbi:HlyD family secretion protein [Rheinheimera aquimaris]|uniref:HlyD family secretion protein n=1 Tax=Rheinheimera aquimaris TaxID=412437 RepID=A0ABN1DHY2_9GAMM|nr:HlyD family secretion protein [Rheinheimera aquimaris]MCB5211961.1 HlyD family secretion protein [Rheinheimera aquimaris]
MANSIISSPAETRLTKPNNRLIRRVFMLLLPALFAVGGVAAYLHGGRFISTDNAYIKADKVPVSARINGPVQDILVQENQQVNAGDILFTITPEPYLVARAKAQATLSQVRSDIAALKASYREKEAEIALAQTKYEFSKKQQARQADLLASHYVSANNYDDAEQTTAVSLQQIATLQQDLQRIAESLGGSVTLPTEQHPAFQAAQAELAKANLDVEYLAVRASMDGAVSKLPKPGQYLAAGATAATLVANQKLWIEANFTETDLTYMQPGQEVTVKVDTYPDQSWHGVVQSLSPATGAEFSIIPAQNATGNWVKITQRVPVRIALQPDASAAPLLAGLSAEVAVDTGHKRSLFGFSL